MFLSSKNTFDLDEIVKGFEVAYRSYVSDIIVNEFSTKDKLYDMLNKINIDKSSLINSGRYNSKLKKIRTNCSEIYMKLKYSYECMQKRQASEENDINTLYVSELIDIVLFLGNPYFNILSTEFDTKDQFVYFSETYKNVRNDLSHPGARKISFEDTKNVMMYISRIIDVIEDKYFWYWNREKIKSKIDEVTKGINELPIVKNNLNEVSFQYKKLIGRENELNYLKKNIIGEEGSYRTANSIVVYGYGGIGKTTLVLEFISELMKDLIDKKISKYEFILFFSSKNEKLNFKQTTGKLYIDPIRQQVSSYKEFINSLRNYLVLNQNQDIYEYMNKHSGIIVIDNMENLKEKDKLIDFIKGTPRTIQYIVTSRNEEMCEEKMNIMGFDNNNNGQKFIDEYIEANNYNLKLSEDEKLNLIRASVGNTLILVTSLERIQSGSADINTIISELMSISSYNTQQIADFMYKNTFDKTLELLNEYKVKKLLQVIALYDEPIDAFAMSELAEIEVKNIEHMCEILTTKLVLYKTQDLFRLNEFASKFIFSKILPDRIELNKLKDRIVEYKKNIKSKIQKLDKAIKKDKFFDDVMNDWKPQNNIDKITIAGAFDEYGQISKFIRKIKIGGYSEEDIEQKLSEIEGNFKNYELKTAHPYIRYQKARVYKLFIDNKICTRDIRNTILNRIKANFEEAKFSVEFNYNYIKNTVSYAAFLWIYGTFLRIYIGDSSAALNVLTESKELYDSKGIQDTNYVKMCNELASCCKDRYEKTNDNSYLIQCKEICGVVLDRAKLNKHVTFDFNRFKRKFAYVL